MVLEGGEVDVATFYTKSFMVSPKVVADAGARRSTSKVPWVRNLAKPTVKETQVCDIKVRTHFREDLWEGQRSLDGLWKLYYVANRMA